jgi:hypothetical protein
MRDISGQKMGRPSGNANIAVAAGKKKACSRSGGKKRQSCPHSHNRRWVRNAGGTNDKGGRGEVDGCSGWDVDEQPWARVAGAAAGGGGAGGAAAGELGPGVELN